jgi:RHS repeat-associated protein
MIGAFKERAFFSAARPSPAATPAERSLGEGSIRILPGQYFDAETGLFYNYYRDYDPQTARYVESDPIGLAGGLNTYGYARQNPLRHVDPTGQATVCVVGASPQDLCYEDCFWREVRVCLLGVPAGCGVVFGFAWYLGSISAGAAAVSFVGCTLAVGGVCAIQKHNICTRRCSGPDPDPNDPWDPNKYPWQRSPWLR